MKTGRSQRTFLFFTIFSLWVLKVPPLLANDLFKPDAPEHYTVQKGDSLWGIAEHFLKDPSSWTEVWHATSDDDTPDLVYPGDLISKVMIRGAPLLTLSRRSAHKTLPPSRSKTLKLTPKIRRVTSENAISPVPLEALDIYLKHSRLVNTPYIFDKAPVIFSHGANRMTAVTGEKVYVRGEFSPARNYFYRIYRKGRTIRDPDTREILGVMAHDVADAFLTQINNSLATLKIHSNRSEVRVGDRLLPDDNFRLLTAFFPKRLKKPLNGKIAATLNGAKTTGLYGNIIINRGERDGLRQGDLLIINKKHQKQSMSQDKPSIRLPAEKVGFVMVYRPFQRASFGLVLSAYDEIKVGDYINLNP
ncbi:hypothetical protein CI610_01612 [invertebrate metagenome]|uniref:LysM domain-containing protein n=1 Tax=invertebrate metagenome TaxID=1711999 RepID=A0A2H9T8C6_9ZZZZ